MMLSVAFWGTDAALFAILGACFLAVFLVTTFLMGSRARARRDKSLAERLSPHCPEVQGCIRCGVCVETPNPFYKLPEKWKSLGTSPLYLRAASV